jgi:hypothetical protein
MTSTGVCFDWDVCWYCRTYSSYIVELKRSINSKLQFSGCATIAFSGRYDLTVFPCIMVGATQDNVLNSTTETRKIPPETS